MTTCIVYFKKLMPTAVIPEQASAWASGVDLRAAEMTMIPPKEWRVVSCGFAMEMSQGIEAQIRPRSGDAAKHGVTVLNAPGTIDADYRGEVKVILINHGKGTIHISVGDRIAQMVFAKVLQGLISELSDDEALNTTGRGEGGFGSTGKR